MSRAGAGMPDDETVRRIVEALSAHRAISRGGARTGNARPSAPFRATAACWVLAVQLYGVRSRRNWGHGDFTDLAALLEMVAKLGGAGIGLNPLHALFYDRPGAGSPYSPNSRLFLNPLYIDVEAIEEFDRDQSRSFADDIARLRDAELVDYRGRGGVEARGAARGLSSFRANGGVATAQDFEAFGRSAAASLQSFAAFEMLRGAHPGAVVGVAGASGAEPSDDGAAPAAAERRRRDRLPRIPAMERRAAACALPRHCARSAVCRSGSISTPRSASMAAAPTLGWRRARCCAGFRSARRRTSTIRPGRTGD